MEKILISACLLGERCRYDGASKPCKIAEKLKERFELILVCPEQAGGLPTPRPPAERRGARVVTKEKDVTAEYEKGAYAALALAKAHGCKLAVLKEKSPSCGCGKIYDGTFSKTLIEGNGVTAELLLRNGIRVIGESEIETLLKEK